MGVDWESHSVALFFDTHVKFKWNYLHDATFWGQAPMYNRDFYQPTNTIGVSPEICRQIDEDIVRQITDEVSAKKNQMELHVPDEYYGPFCSSKPGLEQHHSG